MSEPVSQLSTLAVDHDFAPGVEPNRWDQLTERLDQILASDQLLYVAIGFAVPIALAAIVRARVKAQRKRKRMGTAFASAEGAESGPRDDLAALRRARQGRGPSAA
ncbi:MAG: hypothetical protein AAF192_10040 [Pseudomonadota bacterium]